MLRWASLALDELIISLRRGWGRDCNLNQWLGMLGPAVATQEIIDVGTGAFERPVALRNVGLELVHAVGRLRAVVHFHPDTLLFRDHLALAVKSAAARTVAQILGARHGANVFHQAQDAIPARLASEHRLLEGEFDALQRTRGRGTLVDQTQSARNNAF